MKGSISKILGVLVVVASFVVAQSGWAKEDKQELDCDTLVTGVICAIDYDANSIDVDDTDVCTTDAVTVNGIPLDYLAKWDVLDVVVGLEVIINAHECPLDGKLMACDINEIELRQGALGQNGK